ncbi:MAG: hypothetical protein IAE93_00355 [Ignavibacteria bacterium]|nr:hypothetical protein [Ignavibacteria bacterium]
MSEGINFYIFVSAIVFAAGLYVLLSSKNSIRIITGITMMFSASLINIAAIAGVDAFNAEGQILLYLVSFICLLNIAGGILLFTLHQKKFSTQNIRENISIE